MNRFLHIVAKLVPGFGLLLNRIRFPKLRWGLGVTVEGGIHLSYGEGVSFGDCSRIENLSGTIAIGNRVSFSRNVHLVSTDGCELRIGSGSTVQDDCRVYGDVWLGRRCIIAPNLFVSSGTHVFYAEPALPIQIQEQTAPAGALPVRIGDDCWIGVNTVISRGVTIGRGCVVGASSVVTRDVEPYSVVAGNPAKLIRPRLSFIPKSKIDASADDDAPYFYEGFEYTVQPRSSFEAPDKSFVIVLNTKNAAGVQLRMSGEGELRFGSQTASVPSELGIVKFDLASEASQDFLTFSSDVPCRVYGAEIF